MLRKKIWAPAGIEPTTFQIQVGRTNHWAIGNSYGEQVAGQDFASHEYAGLKQYTDLQYLHPAGTFKVLCPLWSHFGALYMYMYMYILHIL